MIAEAKSSLFGAFKFLAALPPEIRSQLQQLGEGEIANPTPSGQPDIFKSDGRDAVDPGRVRVGGTQATEDELKKGLGKLRGAVRRGKADEEYMDVRGGGRGAGCVVGLRRGRRQ